jgi:DNA-binding beta-propeller fold protein YncE
VFLTMTIVAACLQAGSLAVSPALAEQLTAAGGASSPPVYQGTITDSFSDPEGVSLDGSDLLVTDTGNSRVVELKTDGTEVNTWGSAGSGAGQLYSPRQAVADSGQIDVSDSFNNRVDTFPTAGGPAGQFAGSLSTPRGIAVSPDGQKIAVADTLDNQIVVYDSTGASVLTTIGGVGQPSGALNLPEGVAFDSAGNVWVADTYNDRIVEFDASTGASRSVFDNTTLGSGTLYRPTNLAVDAGGNVWVADWGNSHVFEIDSTGALQQDLTTASGPTDTLRGPVSLAVDSAAGELYVADSGGNRIVEYSIPATQTAAAPTNTSKPTVSGASTPLVGQTFTGYPGTWTGSPTAYQFDWWRCPDTDLSHCTLAQQGSSSTYVLQNADVGDRMILQVYAFNSAGTGSAYEAVFSGVIRSNAALHMFVQNMQVTQGAQFTGLPALTANLDNEPGVLFAHQYAVYNSGGAPGATLIAGQTTVARVFVTSDATIHPRVLLYGYGPSGAALPGSPLLSSNQGTADLSISPPSVKQDEQNGGYTFTLPPSWAQASSKLVAVASPYYQASQCAECVATNALTLNGLSYQQQPSLEIHVDAIKDSSSLSTSDLTAREDTAVNALKDTSLNLYPTGSVSVDTGGIVDITGSVKCSSSGCQVYDPWNSKWIDIENEGGNDAALSALHQFDSTYNTGTSTNPSFGYQLAVAAGGSTLRYASTVWASGWKAGKGWKLFQWPSEIVISAIPARPISGLSHELGHAFGLYHTDGDKSKGGCGGYTAGSGYFDGLPTGNPQGTLDGVGLDRRKLQPDGNYKLLGPSNYGDLMSYCPFDSAGSPDTSFNWLSDPNEWVGPYSWNQAATDIHDSTLPTPVSKATDVTQTATAAGASGGWITVSGMLGLDGKLHVLDQTNDTRPAGDTTSAAGGELKLTADDAAGRPLRSVSFTPQWTHDDVDPKNMLPSQVFSVSLPAQGVASLALSAHGRTLEKVHRSRGTFRLAVPAQGSRHRLRAARSVTLRWRARKGHARLTVQVLYSAGGHSRWQVIYRGLNRNRVTLPGSLLAPSRRARIEVVVSDGFASARRISPPFRVTR